MRTSARVVFRDMSSSGPPVDLLIENGLLVDGSGASPSQGAVAVVGGRLRVADETSGVAARRGIDATGLTVAPGFIDLHSHSGLMILADPLHESKVRQGVTTEVIGVDGLSYAPMRSREDLRALVNMNAGLDGWPDGVAYDWGRVTSYLERLEAARPSVNLAFRGGNSARRMAAVGWGEVPATRGQLDD